MKNLDAKGPQVSHVNEDSDPIDIALNKYVGHPSIFKIKEYFNEPTECNFSEVIPNDIKIEIKNLDSSKEGTFKNITPKSPKEAQYICSPLSCDIWAKEIVWKGAFPEDLKNADVTPVFKKGNSLLTKNYRLLSVLPTVSKIFAKTDHWLYKPISSPLLCGYRKGFIAQTTLLYFTKKSKFMLDKKQYVGAILMDLSKAFNTINYELLVVTMSQKSCRNLWEKLEKNFELAIHWFEDN